MSLPDKAKDYEESKPDAPDYTVGHAVPLSDHADGSDKWKLARKRGLGGSDAAKVLGLQPYGETRISLWKYKTGREESKVGNEATRYGSIVEPYIRQWLRARAQDTPAVWADWRGLQDYPHQMHHPDHTWARANIDGVICDPSGTPVEGVEIKQSTHKYKRGRVDWVKPGVQAYHYPQMQHYMWVTGLSRWRYVYMHVPFDREMARMIAQEHARDVDDYWLWMVDKADLQTVTVDRDDDYIDRLADAEREFWAEHIEPDVKPSEWLPEGEIEVEDDKLAYLLDEYGTAKATLDHASAPEHAEQKKESAKAEIKKLAQSISADHGDVKKIHLKGTDDYVLWHGSGYWVAKPAERTPDTDNGGRDSDIELGF